MLEKPRKLRVFLCHTSADKPKVLELYQRLIAEDWIDPWLDKAKILPGQDWEIVIEKAVDDSDVVIACLSNQSVTKEGYVQREIRYAYDIALEKPEETIFLIPLRLDDCKVPRKLRTLHWVDYFEADKENSYSNLLEALKLRYDQKLRLEAEEFERKQIEQQTQRETEVLAHKLITEQSVREKTAKEKVERETVEIAAREKAKKDIVERTPSGTEGRIKQIATKEKAAREVVETKKIVLPNKEPIVQTENMNSLWSFIVIVLVFFLIYVYSGWHIQSLSSPPAKTPTLIPTGLFVFSFPSVENLTTEIKKLATQTAFKQTLTPSPSFTSTPNDEINPTPVPPGVRPETYTLQIGEFSYCIARRFDVDPDALLVASDLSSPDWSYPGLVLKIPQTGSFPGNRILASHPTTYNVTSSDETLYSIACKYGDVDPASIASANGLSTGAALSVGQQIKIP